MMLKSLFAELWRAVLPVKKELSTSPSRVDLNPSAFASADRKRKEELISELAAEMRLNRGDVDGWTRLGDWQLAVEQPAQAEQAFREALSLLPRHAAAQEGLGLALLKLQQFNEAYLRLEAACKLTPTRADPWVHWGLAELALGNYEQAARKFQSAIDRDPRNHHAWQNLGLVAYHFGQLQACIDAIREAIALRPEDGLAWANLALALRHKGAMDDAVVAARRAVQLKPGSARVWVVQADTLFDQGDYASCRVAIERALSIDPLFSAAQVALGKFLTAEHDWKGARAAFERSLEIAPRNADAEGGIAILELLQQQWASAWDWHEARRRTQPAPVRSLPLAEWDPEMPVGSTVLVHAEQGLGDIILFASCLSDLRAKGAKVIVEVPIRLEKLFARSMPDCSVFGNDSGRQGLAWLDKLGPIDFHLPIGSLPRWFRRQSNAFPLHQGYLHADPGLISSWRRRLADEHAGPGLLIGVTWRGGLVHTAQRHRTLELATLLSAFVGIAVRWVNLQYGDVENELRDVGNMQLGRVHPGISGYANLDEVAALTCACDGVLTVCSTQAHLTGALGRPGIVLVPTHPNWRYGAQGDRSPWYPSLTLARQLEGTDWSVPLQEARLWLARLQVQSTLGVTEAA
ncbi:MAG: hypothetical protein RL375_4024 [Pseudomonadota bacterium]